MVRSRVQEILAVIGLVWASAVMAADDTDTETSTVGGTIPELAQISVAGDQSALLTLGQDGSGETAYDAGFVESATDGVVLTLDANKQWELDASIGNWTDPAGYDKDENDLWVKITNTPTGTVQNSADSYINLSAVDLEILDHTSGVSNNDVDVQVKVDLDWTQDIPGAYSIVLTWTMKTTP